MNKILPVIWTIGAVCGIGALIGWFNIRREAADFTDIIERAHEDFERNIEISVPAAEDEQITGPQVGEIVINVKSDGGIFLNGKEFSEEQLATRINAVIAMYPDQAIILRGDAKTDFQQIIRVLDRIKKAGVWNVAFATTEPEE